MVDYRNPRKLYFDGDINSVLAFRVNVQLEAPHAYVIHLAEALEKGDGKLPNVVTLILSLADRFLDGIGRRR